MGVQLNRTRVKMMFMKPTTTSARSTSLRITGALAAMALLLWAIRYGYQAATEPRRHPFCGQWVSRVGALIMLFGFLLLALGLPIIADLFLGLSEELQCPEDTDIRRNINLKVDVSV